MGNPHWNANWANPPEYLEASRPIVTRHCLSLSEIDNVAWAGFIAPIQEYLNKWVGMLDSGISKVKRSNAVDGQ